MRPPLSLERCVASELTGLSLLLAVGILVTAFIDTQKVLARRYLETSRTLASNLASSRSIQELSEGLLKSLELNERDFPYAMLYHLRTETATGKKCDLTTEGTVFLAGSVGLPFDHSICPRQAVLNLSTDNSPSGTESAARWPLASALEEAFHSEKPVRLTELAVEVPEDMRQSESRPPSTLTPLSRLSVLARN